MVKAELPAVPDDWSAWTYAFERHGLPGTVQTDAPPTLSAYVPPGEEGRVCELSERLREMGARVTTEQVEEVDWSESWKQFFKPMAIGERFWVRPTWENAECPAGRREIVLDPGEAFGTGEHPTTRMCLRLLEQCDLSGKAVADIGCGSGILSIGATLLGASRVDAVDVDAVSVEATLENAERNGVTVHALVGEGFAPLEGAVYDVVVCNIISAAVIALARDVTAHVVQGGVWIVSGIIGANWPDVLEEATRSGFVLTGRLEEGDWVAASLRR